MDQNTQAKSIFEWVCYGFLRDYRPAFVVVVGSWGGIMPDCAVRAIRDNAYGKVFFIEPGNPGCPHPDRDRQSPCPDPVEAEKHSESGRGSGGIIPLRMAPEQALPQIQARIRPRQPGVVIIDSTDPQTQAMPNLGPFTSLLPEGFVLLYGSTSPHTALSQSLQALRDQGYPFITLPREAGLSIIQVRPAADPQMIWDYLYQESNRGQHLHHYLQKIVKPGDRVFDMYCGISPIAHLRADIDLFGFDHDPVIIAHLRELFPQHRWQQIEERSLPFADLPEGIDILVGLGITRPHHPWVPQQVHNNVCYLLGRYVPRACFFESALDYHNADILEDLHPTLRKLGYSCWTDRFESDLPTFPRRQVLIAERER